MKTSLHFEYSFPAALVIAALASLPVCADINIADNVTVSGSFTLTGSNIRFNTDPSYTVTNASSSIFWGLGLGGGITESLVAFSDANSVSRSIIYSSGYPSNITNSILLSAGNSSNISNSMLLLVDNVDLADNSIINFSSSGYCIIDSLLMHDSYGDTITSSIMIGNTIGYFVSNSIGLVHGNLGSELSYSCAILGGNVLASRGIAALDGTTVGISCLAIGRGVISNADGTIALGRYNKGVFMNDPADDPGGYPLFENWYDCDSLFELGNGTGTLSASRSNAITVLKNGKTTLENKYWDAANPTAVPCITGTISDYETGDPVSYDKSTFGVALEVKGHAVLRGNVTMEQPQGDILMGQFGAAAQSGE